MLRNEESKNLHNNLNMVSKSSQFGSQLISMRTQPLLITEFQRVGDYN